MKTLNKIKLGLAGLVFAVGLNNLHGQNSLHYEALEKYAPLTKEQKDSLELNSGLREYINKIYVIDEKDFFEEVWGHAHSDGGILCLTKDYNNRTLLHETGHIRYGVLKNINSDLTEKWKEIANFKYGPHNFYMSKDKFKEIRISSEAPVWKNGKVGPNYGCLAPLSTEFISEDIATFIECLSYEETPESLKKVYQDGIIDDLEICQNYFPLFFADTTDHRYKQKLDLLKEYNFLTKEEHEKLSENLGSLNYLLKEKNKKCPSKT